MDRTILKLLGLFYLASNFQKEELKILGPIKKFETEYDEVLRSLNLDYSDRSFYRKPLERALVDLGEVYVPREVGMPADIKPFDTKKYPIENMRN